MLRAVPMVHLRVQVANRDAAIVTRCVARAGLLHLVDLAHGRIPGMGPPPHALDLLAAFRDLSHRIQRLAQRIGSPLPESSGSVAGEEPGDFEEERERIETELRPVEQRIEASWSALAAARERAAQAGEAVERERLLREAGLDAGRLAALRFARVKLLLAAEEDLAPLSTLLDPAPHALIPLHRTAAHSLVAAVVPATGAQRLESALRVSTARQVPLPGSDRELDEAALAQRQKAALAAAADSLDALAQEKTQALPVLLQLLPRAEAGVLLLQAQTLFASAGRFTVLSGWVPASESEGLRAALKAATGDHAVIDVERPEDLPEVAQGALRVPILHRNPLLLRPFQGLVRLYGTPSYEELEPTAFFAASFLLMFGLMFGDVGHGGVLFLAGFCLFRWLPRFLDYGVLLMECGVASMVFGALYGSLFGLENVLPVLWLRPLHDLPRFMAIAIGLGVVLITVGLVLNVVNLWRARQRVSALFSSTGLFGAFLYWVMLVLLARAFVPRQLVLPEWLLFALLAGAGALMLLRPIIVRFLRGGRPAERGHPRGPRWLVLLEASIELVDTVFTFFANTVSFVRVAAFAAVHAGLSLAIFALVDTLAHVKLGGLWAALALIAGNAVALLLEGLTVSVQVLRLEYYEFFTKFFRGGGEPYRPLMLRSGKGGA